MPPPSATITLDRPYQVVFNLATLVRVETETGRTIDGLVRDMLPSTDGKTRGANLALIVRFIAACLGVGVEELSSVLPLDRTLEVFAALAEAFAEAIGQFSGTKPADAEGGVGERPTVADSGSSEPGPASNSG